MKRVSNFQPLRIGVKLKTEMETEELLKRTFPVAGGKEIASLESLRDIVRPETEKLGELLEIPYNNYLKIPQPFEKRVTRSSKKINDSIIQGTKTLENNNKNDEQVLEEEEKKNEVQDALLLRKMKFSYC